MKYVLVLVTLFCFACSNEKSIEIPQISHSEVHKIEGASKAFVYFDNSNNEVEVNSEKLNNSGNWIIEVDKRLTLKQSIPSIKLIQEKKLIDKLHPTQITKNYFSCKDLSIKKNGYFDFTNIVYHYGIDSNIVDSHAMYDAVSSDALNHIISVVFKMNDSIEINSEHLIKSEFMNRLAYMDSIQSQIMGIVYLKFNENLTFQDYLSYKSMLVELNLKHATFANDEYIFN